MNRGILSLLFLIGVSAGIVHAEAGPELVFSKIEEKSFPGSEPVSVFRLDLKGFRDPGSSLRITRLRAVQMETKILTSNPRPDGTIREEIGKPSFTINVALNEADARRFAAFSEQAIGHRVLLEVNSAPLIAPVIHARLGENFQISLNDPAEAQKVFVQLKSMTGATPRPDATARPPAR